MPLSSQRSRGDRAPRRGGRRRHRGRRRWLLLLLVLAAVGLGVWWLGGEGEPEAPAPPEPAGQAPPAPDSPPEAEAPEPAAPAAPEPVVARRPPEVEPTPEPAPAPEPEAEPERRGVVPPEPIESEPVAGARSDEAIAAMEQMQQGLALLKEGEVIQARRVLSDLLTGSEYDLPPASARHVREALSSLNQKLVFSPFIHPDDPLVEAYTIQSGDFLGKVAPMYDVPYQLLERVNGIDARRIRADQQIKVVRGPFHARVDKSAFRLDLFLEAPDGQWIYVESLRVGLGSDDSTPAGRWIVRPGSKLDNPGWTHPRTGKVYDRDDPGNPIGEYWIGLRGADAFTESLRGYGIHGTIDPDSIGEQRSMGCIRLRDADIKKVFDVLVPGKSEVVIKP